MREQKAWINVCISNHAFLSTFLTLDSSCRHFQESVSLTFFSFKIVSYKVIVILSKFEEIWTGSAAILWTYNGA